ncbi:iron(III) transport system permease protein [Oryzisolibacter propanilivorax]|uniref:Iron(III) transport system permease protein n=1 Tax=Oryzisolibacter propanilivorax TaxID=1527607 RepID=A0A1G9S923_9BURK|nr:iron ABC transporter permease [Oryzisolibacter propanilivorax]SDM31956.1 iron(III) transport system permease protein [Oryzisolibacter propanilivorax]
MPDVALVAEPARPTAAHAHASAGANQALWAWALVGLAAFVLLPWFAVQDGNGLARLAQGWSDERTGNGLVQVLRWQRVWLLAAPAGLLVAALAAMLAPGRRQGALLLAGPGLALLVLLASGFSIGARGWSFGWMNQAWGELAVRQWGLGWGAFGVLCSLLMLTAFGLARRGLFRGDLFVAAAVLGCAALLALFIVFPVAKALSAAFFTEDDRLTWSALGERLLSERNFGLSCLSGGRRCGVAWNTLFIGLLTAASTTLLGTLLALLAERSRLRGSRVLQLLALAPIVTPPFVVGLGLILLFGRAGVVNAALEAWLGVEPTRWFYGWLGIWLAQTFAFTPIAFLIMRGVVQGVAPSMEEAAQTLRASPAQTFRSVTLPLLLPGLANAFLVGFIESMADFGNPIVVGGQFSVLSTEIFFSIVGAQYDQGRAASLAWVLMAFALVAFALQRRLLGRARFTTVSGKGDAGVPLALPAGLARVAHAVALPWMAFTLVIYLLAFAGGFVQTWGRDWTPTLAHFRSAFDVQWGAFGIVWAGTAWNSFFTTLRLAAISAPLTATLGLLIAWLLARTQFRGQGAFEFSALLAFAIPGTVLGVSYILAFNVPPFELTGTALIIVLCFLFRNLPVGVRAGTAAFGQLDRSLDEASLMLRAGSLQTLRHVVLPLLRPALVTALVYSFVRSITTLSAVIFLVTAENELATAYIIGRVGNGDYGVALAYCTVLIALMALATAAIQRLVGERNLGRRAA